MPTRVRVEDLGAKRAQQLAGKDRMKLRIGVLEAEAAKQHPSGPPGVTIGNVAFWSEFGQPFRKPPVKRRSWLYGWLDENIDIIVRQLSADTMRVIFAKDSEWVALNRRGSVYRQQIEDRIRYSNSFPGNAPGTIRKKGFDLPLIDSEEFVESIRYEVVQ